MIWLFFRRRFILYLVFCVVGFGLEWCYGAFWDIVGVAPWSYPESFLHYTSLEGLPLWGFGGLVCISLYHTITEKKVKHLLEAAVSLILALLWIVLYSNIAQ